jgi:hypothetical protein
LFGKWVAAAIDGFSGTFLWVLAKVISPPWLKKRQKFEL